MDRGVSLRLQPGERDLCAAADRELGHHIDVVGDVRRTLIASRKRTAALCADVDDVADGERGGRRHRHAVHDRDRAGGFRVLGDRDDHAALHERRVEGEHRIVAVGEQAADALRRRVEDVGE